MNILKTAEACGMASLLTIAAICGTPAFADDSGWYLGGSLGQSRADIDKERITRTLVGAGLTVTSFDEDDSDSGYKLLGGYQFNRYFALEGGYFDLGEFSFTARTSPPGTLTGSTAASGISLEPVGMWPLSDRFAVIGRIGLSYVETDSAYGDGGAVTAPSGGDERAVDYKLGLGLQFEFARAWALRAEAERYRIDDAVGNDGDVDFYSVGLVYRFFRDAPPPAAVAPAPARVEPILVIVPVAKTVKYCSILDIQFEINRDGIQREEWERLAVLATFLKKYPDTTVLVEGHTDDVGSAEDNLELSRQRAESVVAYLRDTSGIASSRLKAVGYGETRPIADNSTEEGKRQNRRIGTVIACARDIEGLTVVPARITMAMEMEFDVSSAEIRPEHRDELRKVAKFMEDNPSITATVEGHTGNLQGTPTLAMEMSQRRAQSVVNALAELGVARTRLAAQGFGQTRRFAYNTTLEGQQENRRVNIVLNF